MPLQYLVMDEIGFGDARAEPLVNFLTANPGPVEILLNSPGGIATEGAAMLAAIEQHGQVTVRVSGIAASAASLLMVGGKVVTMHREAHVMIHDPAVMAYGNGAKLRKWADDLDKIGATYASAYSRLTGNKIQMVRAWMEKETWMTAGEALALNFCDRIEGDEQPEPVASFDYGMFRHAPAHLVRLAQQNGWATASPDTGKKEITNA